ncbi:MAG TPA: zf-HC2 domain-containing protein [Vicinamibacteria bacterium]|nr:zf-HC2 domain-containing protein [Vicinamibacteria bacterium]
MLTAMDCRRASEALSAWIDGELPETEAAAVASHVGGCDACARRRALLAGIGAAVRERPDERVSATFEDALRRRLAADRGQASRGRVTLIAAGLAAALAAGWLLRPDSPATGSRVIDRPPLTATLRVAGAPALDCGLGRTGGSCRVETPCASPVACGRAVSDDASAMARDARWLAAGMRTGMP